MKARLVFSIDCFDRELIVMAEEDQHTQIHNLLDEAYCRWHNTEEIEDEEEQAKATCYCLEEYMLDVVKKAGFEVTTMNQYYLSLSRGLVGYYVLFEAPEEEYVRKHAELYFGGVWCSVYPADHEFVSEPKIINEESPIILENGWEWN